MCGVRKAILNMLHFHKKLSKKGKCIIMLSIKTLQEQLKENKEFFKFLQKKFNATFKEKKEKPTKETIQALENATSIGIFNNFDEAKKALMSDD